MIHTSSRQAQPTHFSGVRQPEAKVEYNARKYVPTSNYTKPGEVKPAISFNKPSESKQPTTYHRKEEIKPSSQVGQVKTYGGIGAMEKKEYKRPSYGISQKEEPSKRVQSREVKPVTNKDIFGPTKQSGLREKRSVEKPSSIYQYRQEEEKRVISTKQNNFPQPKYTEEPKKAPIQPFPSRPTNPSQESHMPPEMYEDALSGEFGLTPEEQQMQEIIMNSMKDQNTSKHMKPTPKTQASRELNDIPFIEGEDLNESFIAKQRAIEEEFFKNTNR